MTAKASLYSNILEDSRACVPYQAPLGFTLGWQSCPHALRASCYPQARAEQPAWLSARGWAEGFSVFSFAAAAACVPGGRHPEGESVLCCPAL